MLDLCTIKFDHIRARAIDHSVLKNKQKQAGAELGEAQLKLGLGYTSTIDN